MKLKRRLLLVSLISICLTSVYAQDTPADKAAAYTKTITARSNKIVSALGITDSAKYKRVVNIIVDQYKNLNTIQEERDSQPKEAKQQAAAAASAKVSELHKSYLAKLGTELNAAQIDKVKDEMTYKTLPITYKAYLEEVLTLTEVQKAQIKAWLTEARELAMDGESQKKKVEIFGKYKGRINNYLSAQGYDMKKEGEEWQKRIKEGSNKQ